jgi:glycosyltransferase 2 family protein
MAVEVENNSWAGRLRSVAQSLPMRIVVTLALLGIVAAQIDWSRMAARIRGGHPLDFLAAVALVVIALIIGAYRWWLLLRRANVPLGASSVARAYSVGIFSNTFLPTAVGGDVTRALLVVRRGPLLTNVAITIVVERVASIIGLVGMAWIAFAFQSATVPKGAQIFLAWVTAVVVVASLLGFVAVTRGSRLARAMTPRRFMATARQSRSLLLRYANDPPLLVVLLVLSLLFQALVSMQLVMLARAIDVHLAFSTAAVVLALVTVVTLIPISIGGFGVREGSYVVLLGGVSIAATEATLISLLTVATLFIASLPGAYMLVRGGVAPAIEAHST